MLWIREFRDGGWTFTQEGPQKFNTQKWKTPDGRLWDSYCSQGEEGICVEDFWQHDIFKGRPSPDYTCGNYCLPCAEKMTPYVHMMRDIREVYTFLSRLKRSINERRQNDKDNGPT